MAANDDEVLVKFTGNDEQLQQVASRTQSKLNALGSNTAKLGDNEFKRLFDPATRSAHQYGESLQQLEGRHGNANMALRVLAGSAGEGGSAILHLGKAINVLGGGLGAVVGGLLIFKKVMDDTAKSEKELAEITRRTTELIQESYAQRAERKAGGEEGAGATSMRDKLTKEIATLQKKLQEEEESVFQREGPDSPKKKLREEIARLERERSAVIPGVAARQKAGEALRDLDQQQIDFEMTLDPFNRNKVENLQKQIDLSDDRVEILERERKALSGEEGEKAQKKLNAALRENKKLWEEIEETVRKQKKAVADYMNDPGTNVDILNKRATIEHDLRKKLADEEIRFREEQEKAKKEGWINPEVQGAMDAEHQKRITLAKRQAENERYEYDKSRKAELNTYRNESFGAVHGDVVAQALAAKQKTEVAIQDAMRKGDTELAAAARDAGEAQLGKMGINAQRELQSKNKVGFSDLSGFWKSFTTSANAATPAEREQIAALKELVNLTREQAQLLRGKRAAVTGAFAK